MIIVKITVGYVIQEQDTEKKQFVGQCFIASDQHPDYETSAGDHIDSISKEVLEMDYMPFSMVQPSIDFIDNCPYCDAHHQCLTFLSKCIIFVVH